LEDWILFNIIYFTNLLNLGIGNTFSQTQCL
jgi:hypothetical protein